MMVSLIERCPQYTGTCDGVPNTEVSSIGRYQVTTTKSYPKYIDSAMETRKW